jgi:hypothetical protein
MKAGCRRGDRSALAREYRLISLGVLRKVRALDVRRQRNMAVPLDCLLGRQSAFQADDARTALGHLEYLDRESRRDRDASPGLELSTW